MSTDSDEKFMAIALEEATIAQRRGEVPVGALVVRAGEIVARAHNLRESINDSTAHAEMIALRMASKHLKSWRLSDCCLYVTLEPCIMCAGALVQSRISRVVYATTDPKGGATESLFTVCSDPRLNHQVKIRSGVMRGQSTKILKQFFKKCRELKAESHFHASSMQEKSCQWEAKHYMPP